MLDKNEKNIRTYLFAFLSRSSCFSVSTVADIVIVEACRRGGIPRPSVGDWRRLFARRWQSCWVWHWSCYELCSGQSVCRTTLLLSRNFTCFSYIMANQSQIAQCGSSKSLSEATSRAAIRSFADRFVGGVILLSIHVLKRKLVA